MTAATQLREKHEGAYDERAALRLWLRLLSCTMTIEKRLQRRMAERFGSTLPRFDVLAALERHPQGLAMGALSRALLVSNGNVTGLVRGLAAEGLVEVAPSPDDGRVSVARLSERGRKTFAAAAAAHHQWIEDMFGGLEEPERDTLHALLGTLKQSIFAAATPQEGQ
jgi:DNA-binding MarR family transcriptional regulator